MAILSSPANDRLLPYAPQIGIPKRSRSRALSRNGDQAICDDRKHAASTKTRETQYSNNAFSMGSFMKRAMSMFVAAIAATFLAACGGGGDGSNGSGSTASSSSGSQSTPTPAPTPVQPKKTVTVDMEGDSTIFGLEYANGAISQTSKNPPALVQAILIDKFGSVAQTVVQNNGVSGTHISQRINGILPYRERLSDSLVSSAAQIVLGNWAINDRLESSNESPAEFQNYVMQFVMQVRAAGKIPVLEEPNPVVGAVDLTPYVTAIDNVAQQMNVPLVTQYNYILSLPNWKSMLTDGIHPNDDLYALKAYREATVIVPIVAQIVSGQ